MLNSSKTMKGGNPRQKTHQGRILKYKMGDKSSMDTVEQIS